MNDEETHKKGNDRNSYCQTVVVRKIIINLDIIRIVKFVLGIYLPYIIWIINDFTF